MNPENKFSLRSICRFCRSIGGKYTFFNIFKTDNLISKLRQIFKEDIFQADELSHDICSSCFEKVDSCYETISMITSSYNELNRIQQLSKEDENHNLNFEDHRIKTNVVMSTAEIKMIMLSTNEENMESDKLSTVENNIDKEKNEVSLIDFGLQLVNEGSEIQNTNCDDNYEMSILNDNQIGENADLASLFEGEYFKDLLSNIELFELLPENRPDENMTIEEQYYACNMCNFKFNTKVELEMHDKLHKTIMPFVCEICGDTFANITTLRAHVQRHNSECPFTCDICEEGFKIPYLLKVHKATHTRDQEMFGCEICSKAFQTKSLLQQHLLVHSNTKKHECLICHKFFRRSGNLTIHIRKHKENNANCSPYVFCSGCNDFLKNDLDKSIHFMKHSHREGEPFVCSFCGKQFSKWSSMKNHASKHLNINLLYSCEKCSRNFSTSKSLKQHLYLHDDKFPYVCNICSLSFKRLESLKTHKMTHTGERPFVCAICNRCFRQRGVLKTHEKTHLPKEKRNSEIVSELSTVENNMYMKSYQLVAKKPNIELDTNCLMGIQSIAPY